ncbi:MAG TPA: manganese efflux pump [Thermoanaerobaculia bacterium]|nr:manganese efflux pump [Thermoanaerobaculia bacterium]
MTAVFLLGLLVGLDNLQVGAALGMVRMSAARRWAFAGAFALCETAMPLAGLALGHAVADLSSSWAGPWAEGIGVAVLALCGLSIIVLSLRGNDAETIAGGRLTLAGLPLSLSLDNLAAGVGLGSLGFPVIASALVIGVVSGSLCAVGLFAGTQLRRWIPERAELWSGVYLLALAVVRLLEVA